MSFAKRLAAMTSYIQVVTTTARREEAERIARELVERRLAACAQIAGPITSIYRWQGKVETDEEWQCWCKTREALFPQVEEAIRALHPYEVPEILAMPVAAGSQRYLAWLETETTTPRCFP
jgi:periplasmic divalent cation tolerance protein